MQDPYVVPNDEFRMLLKVQRKEKKNLTSYRTEVRLKEKKIGDSSSADEEEKEPIVWDIKKKKVNRLKVTSSAEENLSERDSDELQVNRPAIKK